MIRDHTLDLAIIEATRFLKAAKTLRDAALAVQGEPVAYISQEDFEFIRSDDMSEQYGTRQAPVFSRKDYRVSVPLYASPQAAEQKPISAYTCTVPDVTALVEALEEIERWVSRWCADDHPVATFARKALAAHRKQGGQQ